MALNRQKPNANLIFHSDRGCQYNSYAFKALLSKHKIIQSMSRNGNPYDNAVAENFFSCLKCECIHHSRFASREVASATLFAYIEGFSVRFFEKVTLRSILGNIFIQSKFEIFLFN